MSFTLNWIPNYFSVCNTFGYYNWFYRLQLWFIAYWKKRKASHSVKHTAKTLLALNIWLTLKTEESPSGHSAAFLQEACKTIFDFVEPEVP